MRSTAKVFLGLILLHCQFGVLTPTKIESSFISEKYFKFWVKKIIVFCLQKAVTKIPSE
jgi:hypothetical protein